jgi:hypothetical protein
MQNEKKIILRIKSLDNKELYKTETSFNETKPLIIEAEIQTGEKEKRILQFTKKGNLVLT